MKDFKLFFTVFLISIISLLSSIWLTGCTTTPTTNVSTKFPEPEKVGIYHKVKRGETLWRIATTYTVSIDDIIKSNDIPNVARLEENQLVFIPGAMAVKEVTLSKEQLDNDFIWPVKGKVIEYFRDRDGSRVNNGIDIQVTEGQIVKAARQGNVIFSDYLTGYGYTIVLDHSDGLYSLYAKNAKLLVNLGDVVHRGQEIAHAAKKNNDLAYLHFEIRRNSNEQNPLYYLP